MLIIMSKNKSNTGDLRLTKLTLKINIVAAPSLTKKKLNSQIHVYIKDILRPVRHSDIIASVSELWIILREKGVRLPIYDLQAYVTHVSSPHLCVGFSQWAQPPSPTNTCPNDPFVFHLCQLPRPIRQGFTPTSLTSLYVCSWCESLWFVCMLVPGRERPHEFPQWGQ